MKPRNLVLFAALSASIAIAASTLTPKLYMNGAVASSNLLTKNGVTYAPIGDVAKALGMTVVKRADGFEIKPAGGANMLIGLTGKVGDTLFDGNFQFKVVEVYRGPLWKKRFDPSGGEVAPNGEKDDVLAIVCRIKNGMKKTVTVGLPGGTNTAVTDMDEHSFQPFTGLAVDIHGRGETVLPGATLDFALTFTIPKTAELKDLVYQLSVFENVKQTNFRVSLKPAGQ